jgi:hypothetical protein
MGYSGADFVFRVNNGADYLLLDLVREEQARLLACNLARANDRKRSGLRFLVVFSLYSCGVVPCRESNLSA